MTEEIFKSKKGNFIISEDIYDALCDLTYEWCNIKEIYDKYPNSKHWRKAVKKNELPSLEVIHEFLKKFLPQEYK